MKVIAYHGSTSPVEHFRSTNVSKNYYPLIGPIDVKRTGIFFASRRCDALRYGPYVQKYRLDLGLCANLRAVPGGDPPPIIQQFEESLDPWSERELWLSVRYHRQRWTLFDEELGTRFVCWLKQQGYDSAKFPEDAGMTYVVFDPRRISQVD